MGFGVRTSKSQHGGTLADYDPKPLHGGDHLHTQPNAEAGAKLRKRRPGDTRTDTDFQILVPISRVRCVACKYAWVTGVVAEENQEHFRVHESQDRCSARMMACLYQAAPIISVVRRRQKNFVCSVIRDKCYPNAGVCSRSRAKGPICGNDRKTWTPSTLLTHIRPSGPGNTILRCAHKQVVARNRLKQTPSYTRS